MSGISQSKPDTICLRDDMISWLPTKRVNHERVLSLLKLSEEKGQYTNRGPVVANLEHRFAKMLSIGSQKTVIAVSSGSTAIQAVIGVLSRRLGRLPRIATQAFTFPSSAMEYASHAMILDIDLKTGGPSFDSIPADTEVLIVTNVFGRCVNVEAYQDFCRERKIFLLFDNAAAPLTYVGGTNICNFGDASIVSLHHTKAIGFGEGGLVIIDQEYRDEVVDITGFGLGQDRSTWSKFALNGRMSDISAAYVMQYIEENEVKLLSLSRVQKDFIQRAGIDVYPSLESTCQVHTCIPILCSREIQKRFFQSGIEVKKYYKPLVSMPNSDKMFDSVLNLPSHVDMLPGDYDRYLEILQ